MRSVYWKNVIDIVSTINPDCIDKEAIKKSLNGAYRYDIDMQVLDTLYLRNILTFEEYKEQVSLYIAREELDADYHKNTTLANIIEQGAKYDPMAHYVCAFGSNSATIDSKISDYWAGKLKSVTETET